MDTYTHTYLLGHQIAEAELHCWAKTSFHFLHTHIHTISPCLAWLLGKHIVACPNNSICLFNSSCSLIIINNYRLSPGSTIMFICNSIKNTPPPTAEKFKWMLTVRLLVLFNSASHAIPRGMELCEGVGEGCVYVGVGSARCCWPYSICYLNSNTLPLFEAATPAELVGAVKYVLFETSCQIPLSASVIAPMQAFISLLPSFSAVISVGFLHYTFCKFSLINYDLPVVEFKDRGYVKAT